MSFKETLGRGVRGILDRAQAGCFELGLSKLREYFAGRHFFGIARYGSCGESSEDILKLSNR